MYRVNAGEFISWLDLYLRFTYKQRSHNGGYDDSLLNCNIDCKKHTADRALYSIDIFTSAFERKYYEQTVAFIQSRSLELYKKQTFKTCQLNKYRLSICPLKSEHNYSDKMPQNNAHFIDDAF